MALSTTQTRFETNLADYQTHLAVHQGWIPDTFVNISPDQQFVFIHIDVDLYQPTKDSVTFFYPRMPAGAVLLCDDYGLTTCPGATRAMDEFLQDKPEKMIALSAGSGFFIKGTTTQVSVEPLRA